MKVLLVEDDLKIAGFLREGLQREGFELEHASDGLEGLNLGTSRRYDAFIVDLMLPRLDGLSLIERLRHFNIQTPVLILSAKQSVDDRVEGLKKGGDDYLTKPFALAELAARLHSLLRRSRGVPESTRMTVGSLVMDLLKHEVTRADQRIELQPKEFALLRYLMQNAGRVVTKAMIMKHVWDYNFDPPDECRGSTRMPPAHQGR